MRVYLPAIDGAAPAIAEVYERFAAYGPFADQAAVMAHVPPALDHLYRMLMELKARRRCHGATSNSASLSCPSQCLLYCVASHSPVLQIEGLPAADRAASEWRSSRSRRRRPAGDRVCDVGDANADVSATAYSNGCGFISARRRSSN